MILCEPNIIKKCYILSIFAIFVRWNINVGIWQGPLRGHRHTFRYARWSEAFFRAFMVHWISCGILLFMRKLIMLIVASMKKTRLILTHTRSNSCITFTSETASKHDNGNLHSTINFHVFLLGWIVDICSKIVNNK